MTCPRCHVEQADSARFCTACGAALPVACSECGFVNSGEAIFCGGCGKRTRPTAWRRARGPEATVGPPPHLANVIRRDKSALEGERKVVTVLFADVTGSLELLAARDPEDARDVLDPILEHMMAAVHRYEGTVNQVMGDGIMALFGAPVAHEDHAARACYAALAMQESVRRYARTVEAQVGAAIQIRVGLNSGEVVVRAIDSDLHMDYSAIGETTHLASRMEATAPPGSIRLTLATVRLAEPFVQARAVGPIALKGRREPVEAFELVGARAIRRAEATVLRGLTRFVDRERELAALGRAVDDARAGHGGVTAIVGEPGIGKSRLVLELEHSPAVGGCLVLDAGTVSYGRGTAYLPIIDLLRRYFGLADGDSPAAARDKVTRTLVTLDARLAEAQAPLLVLLGVPPDDSPFPTYDPRRRRELTQEALKQLFVRLGQVAPLVLVVEDLHWIDDETQSFLDRLVESLAATRIVLVVTYRPEYRHDWGGWSNYAQIDLQPLPRDEVETLLTDLLGDHPNLRPLKDLLIERTDGNAFFLEESIRALVDGGLLHGEAGRYEGAAIVRTQVPATVQAVLAARIDRLPADEKTVLQCASVVGKDIRVSLLRAIAGLPEAAIEAALDNLRRLDFVFETHGGGAEPVYSFKHALTNEVAYGELLHERAKSLHAAMVATLERLYPDRLADHAEALAHHAVRGEVWPKAVDYLRLAGAAAFARAAVEESLGRYQQALGIADRLPVSADNVRRRIDVRLDLHVPLIVLGQVSKLIELHAESERLAREVNDAPRLARLLHRMSQYAWMEGRFRDGIERAQQALEIADLGGDADVRILATYALGLNHYATGAYRSAIDLFQRIVDGEHADLARRLLAVTVPAYIAAAGWLGYALALVGDVDRALVYTDRAAQAADECDHPQAQAIAYTMRVIPLVHRGQTETAVALAERALRLCEEKALVVWLPGAAAALGWALALAGRASEGEPHLERAATLLDALGIRSNLSQIRVWWADALLMEGRLADARRCVERALELAVAHGEQGYEAAALHTLATVIAAGPDAQNAAAQYERALALAFKLGMLPLVGRCHLGLGRLYLDAGDRENARPHLARAATLFRDMGLQRWLAETEAAAS
ncbi:MAG TPA: adenylate/guanylate cyclase domain-containing protein [Methylomirabilota bacterium]